MDEIELKFLDINVKEIKEKLKKIGAKVMFDTEIESYPFLAEGFDAWDSDKKFLRIRKVDDSVIVTYKDPARESKMTSKKEIEFKVDDYKNAILLFEKIGFKKGEIFTKHRVHYELGDIHFELDTLVNVPTYLEIETQTEDAMLDICGKLKLDISKGKKGTIVEILPHLFKVKTSLNK